MELPAVLIEFRKKHNLSQTEMATMINISEPLYKFLEYGEPLWDTEPFLERIRRLDDELKRIHSPSRFRLLLDKWRSEKNYKWLQKWKEDKRIIGNGTEAN